VIRFSYYKKVSREKFKFKIFLPTYVKWWPAD